jgi:hypothetical protein
MSTEQFANLRGRQLALRSDLQALRRQCRLTQSAVTAGGPSEQTRRRCPQTLRAVYAVLAVTSHDQEAARSLWNARRRGRADGHLMSVAHLWAGYAHLSAEEVCQETAPSTAAGQRALYVAQTFLLEKQLHAWIRMQNDQKGLAPSSRRTTNVLREATGIPDATHDSAVERQGPVSRTQRQWLRRWARRWSVFRGRVKAGDKSSTETERRKTRLGGHQKAPPPRTTGSKTRTGFRSQKQDHHCCFS